MCSAMDNINIDTSKVNEMNHKNPNYYNAACNSSAQQITPVKENESTINQNGCFKVLPNCVLSPAGFTKFIAKNPFENDLARRLHLSVMSPNIFSKVSKSESESTGFSWSVDELAVLKPAKIEENILQVNYTDPEVEKQAQAAITKFFSQSEIVPSPWELRKVKGECDSELHTPTIPNNESRLPRDSPKKILKKDAWCQTVLTLPMVLPSHVEECLKPYFSFTQEQNVDTEEVNLSNSSLRRKLFFNNDDYLSIQDNSRSLSPIHVDVFEHSPPQRGILSFRTPLKQNSEHLPRTHGTPLNSMDLSPPNISPIGSDTSDILHEINFLNSEPVLQIVQSMDMSTETPQTNENSEEDSDVNNENSHMMYMDIDAVRKYNSLRTDIHLTKTTTFTLDNVLSMNSNLFEESVNNMNIDYGKSQKQIFSQDTGYHTHSISNSYVGMFNNDKTPERQKIVCHNRRSLPISPDSSTNQWEYTRNNVYCSTPSTRHAFDSDL